MDESSQRLPSAPRIAKLDWERLEVQPATLAWLRDKGVEVRVLQTEEAVECFNALAEIAPVGGLFHSTY